MKSPDIEKATQKISVDRPDILWWLIKVLTAVALISALFLSVIFDLNPWFESSRRIAQGLVILGGLGTLYHFVQLKRHNSNIESPLVLETKRGLYRLIRHPMYLGDAIFSIGLFLLIPSMPTILVLLLNLLALERQSKSEDDFLEGRFGEQYASWKQRTKRLLPYLY